MSIQSLRARRRDEEGFTLIELMVVVLIIAILIAIAIPTFLGARERAQNRAAQSNARNALTAEKTIYTDAQSYTSVSATLTGVEPSLNFVTDAAPATATPNQVAVTVHAAGDTVWVGVKSKSNTCFCLKDTTTAGSAGTTYGKGTCTATSPTGDPSGITFTNSW